MSADSGTAVAELQQVEHAQIETALDLEQLDLNLFRSKTLWIPFNGRGVFGGQVISQALVSATKSVDASLALHSLHCYFLSSAKATNNIIYFVERLREGKSYATRAVKAGQNGKVIFILICSFQRPEPWQPTYQWKMPLVPPPEDLDLEEDRFAKLLKSGQLPEKAKTFYENFRQERIRSPIAVKAVRDKEEMEDGSLRFMFYMRAKNLPTSPDTVYPLAFQKCILSYLSDLYFVGVAPRTLGFKRFSKGPKATGMVSSLDHSIHFYSDKLNCGDWLLYVITCPRAGNGRAVVRGQMFSRDGTLVAVLSQEGVVRADIRGPEAKL